MLQTTGIDTFQFKPHSVSWAYASAAARSGWLFATLRLRWAPGRDSCQSALCDCLGDKFAAMLKMRPPKQSHNALDSHLDPVSRATSKWRISNISARLAGFLTLLSCVSVIDLCKSRRRFADASRSVPEKRSCL